MGEPATCDIDSDVDEQEAPQFQVDVDEEFQAEEDVAGQRDNERLQRDTGPFPPLYPPLETKSVSEARAKATVKIRQEKEKEAVAALAAGDNVKAIEHYSEAMRVGGATAMMLAIRGGLLLNEKRPMAAIRDCTAALKVNSSFVKAYRIRGTAHRKLGHWKKAHRDLKEAQGLKFDASLTEMATLVSASVQKLTGGEVGALKMPTASAATAAAFQGLSEETKPLDRGQAVLITGLKNAPHLNGKRGVVEREDPRPAARGRWEVEVRVGGGRVEIKSLKRENIVSLNKADRQACKAWAAGEKKHKEEKRLREEKEEQEKYRKCVDMKMAELQLDLSLRDRLRKLPFQETLDLLDRASNKTMITNANAFLTSQLDLLTSGHSDSEEPPAKKQKTQEGAD